MRQRLFTLTALLAVIGPASCSHGLDFSSMCYQDLDPSTNMPRTLDNLLGLVNKFENTTTEYNPINEMAEMLINEYRQDGYIYLKGGYTRAQGDKSKNIFVVDIITRPSYLMPEGTYDEREQCGLHMLLSHSIDHYPFAGVTDLWDGTIDRAGRERRQLMFDGEEEAPVEEAAAPAARSASGQLGYQHVQNELAEYPLENGVMETAYGPVAAGTLLTGLITLGDDPVYNIGQLEGINNDDVPVEVRNLPIRTLYASTLSGDMGEMALDAMTEKDPLTARVGPPGRYHNCTACAKQFSLQEQTRRATLTRAELYAGLDALILHQGFELMASEYKNKLTLSELLKFYYSEKGLPGLPEYRACNRMALYQQLDAEEIYNQALNYMYAFTYQNPLNVHFYDIVIANGDQLPKVDAHYRQYLDQVKSVVEDYINRYSYDEEGYATCEGPSSGSSTLAASTYEAPPGETVADVVFVYAEQQPTDSRARNQRQMIADVARRLRYDAQETAIGVMGSPSGQWIEPVANITNIGDWACNFTADYSEGGQGGSNSEMLENVFQALIAHYAEKKVNVSLNEHASSGRSQVVVWQVPDNPSMDDTNNETVQYFRYNFPEVRIIFVGNNQRQYRDNGLLIFEDDFVETTNKLLDQVTSEVLKKVHSSPRPFIYPRCGSNDLLEENENYKEESHVYHGAVSSGRTTFIQLPPSTFQYSRNVTLMVTGEVQVCASRTNRFALPDYKASFVYPDYYIVPLSHDTLKCSDNGGELAVEYPCDMYLETCNPIFLSITANGTNSGCTGGFDDQCDMPGQIRYELSHRDMTCGAATSRLALLLLLSALLLRLLH